MASFVHITDERLLRDIKRAGIKPSKRDFGRYAPPGWPKRYVFCAPVLRDAESTFHWMRELAGPGGRRRGIAVQFRLPDDEKVLVGVFGGDHAVMTSAEAVAAFMRATPDPRGMQVLLPRAVSPREISATRAVPSFIGWRYTPFARLAPPSLDPRPSVAERKRRGREDKRLIAEAAAEQPLLWRRLVAAMDPRAKRWLPADLAHWLSESDPAQRVALWREFEESLDEPVRLQGQPGRD